MANPVIWFNTPVVTEVKKYVFCHFLIPFYCQCHTGTNCDHNCLFIGHWKSIEWLGRIFRSSKLSWTGWHSSRAYYRNSDHSRHISDGWLPRWTMFWCPRMIYQPFFCALIMIKKSNKHRESHETAPTYSLFSVFACWYWVRSKTVDTLGTNVQYCSSLSWHVSQSIEYWL
jgi:hypothetical protein